MMTKIAETPEQKIKNDILVEEFAVGCDKLFEADPGAFAVVIVRQDQLGNVESFKMTRESRNAILKQRKLGAN